MIAAVMGDCLKRMGEARERFSLEKPHVKRRRECKQQVLELEFNSQPNCTGILEGRTGTPERIRSIRYAGQS